MLQSVLSVCVCVSVTSRSYFKTAERITLGFGTGASFHLSLYLILCYKEIRVPPKIRELSS